METQLRGRMDCSKVVQQDRIGLRTSELNSVPPHRSLISSRGRLLLPLLQKRIRHKRGMYEGEVSIVVKRSSKNGQVRTVPVARIRGSDETRDSGGTAAQARRKTRPTDQTDHLRKTGANASARRRRTDGVTKHRYRARRVIPEPSWPWSASELAAFVCSREPAHTYRLQCLLRSTVHTGKAGLLTGRSSEQYRPQSCVM